MVLERELKKRFIKQRPLQTYYNDSYKRINGIEPLNFRLMTYFKFIKLLLD